MGAEQSNKSKKDVDSDEKYERMMKSALDQQRKMYEAKCQEMLQKQKNADTGKVNVAQPNTPVAQPHTNYSPLYPNLKVPKNVNMQPSTSSAYYQAQTSNIQNQVTFSERPLHNNQLVSQANQAVNYNFEKKANIVFPTSRPMFMSNPTNNYHASAPTAPELSAVSQQKHNKNITQKSEKPQCPTCKINCLGDYIFQCQKGHSSCSQCKASLVKCGICNCIITKIRNIDLEHFLANVQQEKLKSAKIIECPNKSDGCRLSRKPEYMADHLKECVFREMECPIASVLDSRCLWRGKVNQLQAHILECHPNQTGADVDKEMYFAQSESYVVHYVAIGKFNFLVHLKLDTVLETLFMTVQLVGSLVVAAQWTYELHVYDESKPQRKYTYIDVCLPNSIPFGDACKESKCAALPLLHVLSFFKDNKMSYKFYIKRTETKHGRPNQRRDPTAADSSQNINTRSN